MSVLLERGVPSGSIYRGVEPVDPVERGVVVVVVVAARGVLRGEIRGGGGLRRVPNAIFGAPVLRAWSGDLRGEGEGRGDGDTKPESREGERSVARVELPCANFFSRYLP